MAIDTQCSGCNKTLRVADDCVGRKARCPNCGTIYIVRHTDSIGQQSKGADQQPSDVDHRFVDTTYAENTPSHAGQAPLISYMVRVPNGDVFGPADAPTIFDWIQQGRLDDRCHARKEGDEQWIGLNAWRLLQKKEAAAENIFANSPQSLIAPRSSNQSATNGNAGRGTAVLILGILSWLLCFSLIGGVVCAAIAIPLGFGELKRIREGASPASEKSLVMIGMGLSIANLAVSVLTFVGVAISTIINA